MANNSYARGITLSLANDVVGIDNTSPRRVKPLIDVRLQHAIDDLRRRFANPSLKDVRPIAIDEICVGKGYRYVSL